MFVDVCVFVTQNFQIANEKIQHHLDWLSTTPCIDLTITFHLAHTFLSERLASMPKY